MFFALFLLSQLQPPTETLWSLTGALSPDGKSIALGVNDGSLRCIELDSGKERFRERSLSRSLEGISWSRDGERLATISREGVLSVLNARSGEVKATFGPFSEDAGDLTMFVHSVDFVDGDSKFMSRGGAAKARLLDAATGKLVKEITYGARCAMTTSVVSADGRRFAVGNACGEFAVHSAVTGEVEAGVFQVPECVYALAFDPRAERMAVGAGDSTVRVYALGDGAAPLELQHKGRIKVIDPPPSIGGVCFSPDGKTLVSSTCHDFYEVRCWSLAHSSVLWKYEYQFGTEFPAPVTYSKTGDLAMLWLDGIVLNARTGETVRTLGAQSVGWHLSSTGDRAWVCSQAEVQVSDVRDGKLVCTIRLAPK